MAENDLPVWHAEVDWLSESKNTVFFFTGCRIYFIDLEESANIAQSL